MLLLGEQLLLQFILHLHLDRQRVNERRRKPVDGKVRERERERERERRKLGKRKSFQVLQSHSNANSITRDSVKSKTQPGTERTGERRVKISLSSVIFLMQQRVSLLFFYFSLLSKFFSLFRSLSLSLSLSRVQVFPSVFYCTPQFEVLLILLATEWTHL